MAMDRRHLACIAAVAAHRNVTRAAEEIGITQPALSRTLKEAERLLGVRLFDRLPQGVVPTKCCEQLLERARDLLAGFDELERGAQILGERYHGPLALGLGPAVAGGSAILEVGRLVGLHRELRCRVVVASTIELAQQLRRLELDFFVADQSSHALEAEPFEVEALEQPAYLFCRAGHPVLRAALPLRQVPAHPVAALGPTPAGAEALRAALRRAGAEIGSGWEPSLWVSHPTPLRNLMLHDDVIGAATAYALAPELRAGALRFVPPLEPFYHGHVGAVRLRNRTLSPAAAALWGAIMGALKSDLALPLELDGAGPAPRPAGPTA
jgi:DNA-binding transcriptional LysR family regulator